MRIALMNACRAADPRPTRVRRPNRNTPHLTTHTAPLTAPGRGRQHYHL